MIPPIVHFIHDEVLQWMKHHNQGVTPRPDNIRWIGAAEPGAMVEGAVLRFRYNDYSGEHIINITIDEVRR
jgi:hypothetical protein